MAEHIAAILEILQAADGQAISEGFLDPHHGRAIAVRVIQHAHDRSAGPLTDVVVETYDTEFDDVPVARDASAV